MGKILPRLFHHHIFAQEAPGERQWTELRHNQRVIWTQLIAEFANANELLLKNGCIESQRWYHTPLVCLRIGVRQVWHDFHDIQIELRAEKFHRHLSQPCS